MRGPDSALDRMQWAKGKPHRIPSEHKDIHFSCEGSDTGTGGPKRLQSPHPWKCLDSKQVLDNLLQLPPNEQGCGTQSQEIRDTLQESVIPQTTTLHKQ